MSIICLLFCLFLVVHILYVRPALVKLCPGHPNVDNTLRTSYSFPTTHPSVQPLLQPFLPRDHPSIQPDLKRNRRVPSDHPAINPYLVVVPPNQQCMEFTNYKVAKGCPVNVSTTHPSVDSSLAAGRKLPTGHVLTDPRLRSWLPPNHRNTDVIIASGRPIPFGHPIIDHYLCKTNSATLAECRVPVSSLHPSVDNSINVKRKLPTGHPLTHSKFQACLPTGHPNTDSLLSAGTQLPAGHPVIDNYMMYGAYSVPSASDGILVPYDHPSVDSALANGQKLPFGHPLVNPLLEPFLPVGHENCDDLIAAGTPLPIGHPSIDAYLTRESMYTPGLLMAIVMTSLFVLVALYRLLFFLCKKTSNSSTGMTILPQESRDSGEFSLKKTNSGFGSSNSPTRVMPIGKFDDEWSTKEAAKPINLNRLTIKSDTESANSSQQPSVFLNRYSDVLQSNTKNDPVHLPRRNLQVKQMEILNAQHHGADVETYEEYRNITVPAAADGRIEIPEELLHDANGKRSINSSTLDAKTNSICSRMVTVLNDTRIHYLDWSLGNLMMILVYLSINIVCLVVSPIGYGRGWGSLAAINTVLLIIPATRNSIIALVTGVAFDHVVVYHRFLGRFLIFCITIHFGYFLLSFEGESFVYMTGLGAYLCTLVIFITSLNYFRRNYFNVFYWSHYSFVGFLGLAYVHCSQTKPYILAAICIYAADKLLRFVWMAWPRRTLVFRNKGPSIAQVRFKKNPLTKLMSMHKVAQYYFVNFPALSLHEWHPFSVSSGPREDFIEMHIRALGDHTKLINAYAKEREASGHPAWICIDGPYGSQTFNYRRYPMMLLVGGGIGVTPVMGMLKDIYDIGLPDEQQNQMPHAIETVYFLWVMPSMDDYDSFKDEIDLCLRRSHEPGRPRLVLSIYITRSKDDLSFPFIAGRPNVDKVFQNMLETHPDSTGLVFGCGPQPLVAELWDKSIQHTIKGRRIDFHHEVFDF